jgi:hypothetical protein
MFNKQPKAQAQQAPPVTEQYPTWLNQAPTTKDYWQGIKDDVGVIRQQLDNSTLLNNLRCFVLGGYLTPDGLFHKDDNLKQWANESYVQMILSIIDTYTDANQTLSILNEDAIETRMCMLMPVINKTTIRNHTKYDIDLDTVEVLLTLMKDRINNGMRRAIAGKTLQSINKLVSLIEQRITKPEDEKRGGFLKR